jgi:hypothetical protein
MDHASSKDGVLDRSRQRLNSSGQLALLQRDLIHCPTCPGRCSGTYVKGRTLCDPVGMLIDRVARQVPLSVFGLSVMNSQTSGNMEQPVTRPFRRVKSNMIAPPLARLIQKERGGERVWEGYFPDQPHHSAFVQIKETRSSLTLEAGGDETSEERADIPPAHAEALLAVSQGQVEYVRTRLSIGSREIQALHFVRPGPLDLVMVTVAPEEGQDFHPLPWLGPEVSANPAYRRRRMALDGRPDAPEVDLTDAALSSLLDLLEDRVTMGPVPQQAGEPDAPTAGVSPPSDTPVPGLETEAEDDIDDLGIDDAVIRELARALQPQGG